MWAVILIIVGAILIYKFGKRSGETIGRVQTDGGMRLKYSVLIKNILEGHRDCKILVETRTYIRVGVMNYGGSTIFHIQQCPNDTVMIDYHVANNPAVPNFSLRFTFPYSKDQNEMMEEIGLGIQRKMMSLY